MTLLPYSENQILERLRFENPWWVSGQVEEYYASMQRRLYFNMFMPLILKTEVRRAVVLMGPRRVGKTVMIYHTVQGLLDNDVDPLKIAYISVETPIYNNISLEQLFGYCRKATKQENPKGFFLMRYSI